MMTVSHRTGRLIGLCIQSPVTDDEMVAFLRDCHVLLQSFPRQMVFCSDMRGISVLTGAMADQLSALMRRHNPKLERAAILLPSNRAVVALQFERMVREAGSPARRTFREVPEAKAWLEEILTPAERTSMLRFIEGLR